MRTEEEIQRAHDVLCFIEMQVEGVEIIYKDERVRHEIGSSKDVLCWILGHKNETFEKNLLGIEGLLFGKGIRIERTEDGIIVYKDTEEFSKLVELERPKQE